MAVRTVRHRTARGPGLHSYLFTFSKDETKVLASEVVVWLGLPEEVIVEVRLVQLDVFFARLMRLALLRGR